MTHEHVATDLITPLWRGISPDYKRKYVFHIWTQLEDNLRSAAYTSKLTTFLDKITLRLGIVISKEDTEKVTAVIQCGTDKAILKMLRDETTLLVLLVRVANEERKSKFQKKESAPDANVSVRGQSDSALFGES